MYILVERGTVINRSWLELCVTSCEELMRKEADVVAPVTSLTRLQPTLTRSPECATPAHFVEVCFVDVVTVAVTSSVNLIVETDRLARGRCVHHTPMHRSTAVALL